MKDLQKYIVIQAYGPYRKGAIIQPTGMLRSELLSMGRIKKYEPDMPAPEPVAEAPAVAPEPEPETATAPRVENAQRWNKGKNRGRG